MPLPNELNELIDFSEETLRVSNREGKTREFKESFKRSDLVDYGKTLAAFSNADGGTIIFGVTDRPRRAIGFDATNLCDDADIVSHLRDSFHPEIPFSSQQYEHNGGIIYAIQVDRCTNPPVICRKGRSKSFIDSNGTQKDRQITNEGSIYYRYSAKSRNIDYSELNSILEERERRKMQSILETLKAVEKIGFEKVGVVDATALAQPEGLTNLYISKETAKSMNFIEQGRFTESDEEGSPAYYITRQVRLNEAIHAPLEEEDRNLPSEAARILLPTIQDLYGDHMSISAAQVTKLIRYYNLENMPYHEYDKKIGRRYITRAGIEILQNSIRENPLEAIRVFASRPNIDSYEAAQRI